MRHLKRYTQLFEGKQELTKEQIEWLDDCSGGSWKLNSETGLVDVRGNFFCNRMGLTDFKGVRFGRIDRDFRCQNNRLTSLEGAPRIVGGSFICSENRLSSLVGAPQKTEDGFNCSGNLLTSLKGAPQSVGGSFSCHQNSLTSLKGAPKIVRGNFNCSVNSLTTLEGGPEYAEGNYWCSYNMLTSLKGAPRVIEGTFSFSKNNVASLEGAPLSVSGGISCEENPISVESINNVFDQMQGYGTSLGDSIGEVWDSIKEEDKPYLAKQNTALSRAEKKAYEDLLKFRNKVI